MKTRIMYIENKSDGDGLTGSARIGRVRFSKSGKSMFYQDAELRSLKGLGYKANYVDVNTGDYYWVSGPKKNGQDTLYGDQIEVDEDVREEYWGEIRSLTDLEDVQNFKSDGKHTGWRTTEYKNKKRV